MHDLDDDTLMGLAEFRKLLHLSPSGERRMRGEQQDWPPHLSLGRKVFYFRDGVRDFLMRRLGAQVGVQPEGGVAVVPDSGGLGGRAPAFTAEQLVWLRALVLGTGFLPGDKWEMSAARNSGFGGRGVPLAVDCEC